jgi:hypothetical protein
MADEPKARPAGAPQVPGRIVEGLREAIADPRSRPRAYIRLTASGGVHGETYEFEYLIDASGHTVSQMRDELTGRNCSGAQDADRGQGPDRFQSLAKAIDIESLIRMEQPSGGFPPDSVVGRLEVSDGEQSVSFTFLADVAQAARAQVQPPEPLRRAVDAIYGNAAAYLHDDDLKP